MTDAHADLPSSRRHLGCEDCHAGRDPDNIRITAVEPGLSITEIWHTDQRPTHTVGS
ncbi:hypothetical protein AB0O91_41010 [Kitasatospora sp. NPDC089797]|uniref:hypothetical protein n=1 Tax=Kitasatospora sp. NPDC089797 TaxID=3155298 RepID=UPI003441CA88